MFFECKPTKNTIFSSPKIALAGPLGTGPGYKTGCQWWCFEIASAEPRCAGKYHWASPSLPIAVGTSTIPHPAEKAGWVIIQAIISCVFLFAGIKQGVMVMLRARLSRTTARGEYQWASPSLPTAVGASTIRHPAEKARWVPILLENIFSVMIISMDFVRFV